jgi:hypothetical protein
VTCYPIRTNRRGVALPLALFTLVIAAVMITAVFYVGRLEQRMGYNSVAATQAFEAAETGVATVLTNWSPSYGSLATGATTLLPTTAVGGNAVYTASIRRLNTTLFLLQAEGRFLVAGLAVTRRQVARVLRLDPPEIEPEGALTTRLGIAVTDNATIDGSDNVPGGWGVTCPPPLPQVAAIVDSAGAVITTGPCTGQLCLTGTPKILTQSSAGMSAYNDFGTETFASLAAAAGKVVSGSISGIAPSTIPGPPITCNTADPNNWGDALDPSGTCGNYFPIIYAPGDLDLAGGIGQGVLLVQGNLSISGSFQFYGIVVVQGLVTATDGEVYGALLTASDGGVPAGSIGGTAEIKYSHCAVDRAATGAAQPRALSERSWIQLY